MSFPTTKRYWLRFRHEDTGLTPVFVYFKNAGTLADITPPSITELENGAYYFDWTYATKADPDVVFEVDGGASIPTEEVRYITDAISPKDAYLDEPISQVVTDVWTDSTSPVTGTKGANNNLIPAVKTNTDLIPAVKAKTDNLPGDPASQAVTNAEITAAESAIMGAQSLDISTIAGGAAFVSASDSLHAIKNQVATLTPPDNAGIAAIKAKTDNLPTDTNATLSGMSDSITRALGMLHENSVLDSTSFDSNNNMTAGRLRIYDSKANAQAAGSTGLLASYAIVATYTGTNLTTYTVTRES